MTDFKKQQVIVVAENSLLNEVDLRFLPSMARFVTDVPEIRSYTTPVMLVIVSSNPQQLLPELQEWLVKKDSSILFLWDITKHPNIGYALSQIPEIAAAGAFYNLQNSGLLLVSHGESEEAKQLKSLSIQLLKEPREHRMSIPNDIFKKSLWRYSYLLKAYGDLSEKDSKNEKNLHQLEADLNELKQVNKNLEDKLHSQKEEFSKLQLRYRALSNSKLGSLTLKIWAKRRK